MRHFRIRKGEWPSATDRPPEGRVETASVRSAAITGADFPGLRPRFEVEEGARVIAGQVLFRDRGHPDIAFVSPLTGRVASLEYAARRTLSACVVEAETFDPAPELHDVPSLDLARQTLLFHGLWPAFRTRPFGRLPAPDAMPAAIFVNAVQAAPQAPDPQVVLEERRDDFDLGVQCLTRLTDGSVFICQSPGAPLVTGGDRTTCVAFSGSLAAGLAGTQIDRLHPATPRHGVWTIGYQDVAAIGHLFLTGRYDANRVVSIVGPGGSRPRLVRCCLGARVADLGFGRQGEKVSGDAMSGSHVPYLGRYDDQVALERDHRRVPRTAWLDRLVGHPKALIPNRRLERALAVDLPVVPLLRALAIGDSEAALRLGCLSLVEEDLAVAARRCTSGADYPHLLRQVLNVLREDFA